MASAKRDLRILLTNDDGIKAPGLWALADKLQHQGRVVVVAPDREQSAVSSAITLHQPLRVSEVKPLVEGIEAYAVEGTPADSVILGLRMLMKDGVDVVVSGINEGVNVGDDVFLSGTVGGAMQGYFQGIPAIAVSVAMGESFHFEPPATLVALLASKIGSAPSLNGRQFLNVNFPNLPLEDIKGLEITRLAHTGYVDRIEKGHDGKRDFYWIKRGRASQEVEHDTDLWAIQGGKISIAPLHNNLTCAAPDPSLQTLGESLFQSLRG